MRSKAPQCPRTGKRATLRVRARCAKYRTASKHARGATIGGAAIGGAAVRGTAVRGALVFTSLGLRARLRVGLVSIGRSCRCCCGRGASAAATSTAGRAGGRAGGSKGGRSKGGGGSGARG